MLIRRGYSPPQTHITHDTQPARTESATHAHTYLIPPRDNQTHMRDAIPSQQTLALPAAICRSPLPPSDPSPSSRLLLAPPPLLNPHQRDASLSSPA